MKPRYWHGLQRAINPLGFGCWQLSGEYSVNGKPQGWGPVDTKEAISLIHYALHQGIQFFDTAAAYGNGRSEEIVGTAINSSSAKNDAVVCTKVSLTETEEQNKRLEPNFEDRVKGSLKRLKRDKIDILLIHNPPDTLKWSEFDYRVLDNLKTKGLIGTYGVSSRSLAGVKNVMDYNFGTCIEWVFNLLERRPTVDIFPKLNAVKMNFIARSPLSRGLFSSKYSQHQPEFDSDDFRSTLPMDWIEWTLNSIKKIKNFNSASLNLTDVAIKYCLSFDEMSVVIPGMRKKAHIEDFVRVANKEKLNSSFMESLSKVTEDHYPNWT